MKLRLFAAAAAIVAATAGAGAVGNPVAPPQTGAYLGVFANPQGVRRPPPQVLMDATSALESSIAQATGVHRVLALHLHFLQWDNADQVTSNRAVADDFAKGRTPVITWTCGDSLRSIASGADDQSRIVPIARAFAALHKPVMMRWFHEFNFNVRGTTGNGQAANCFDAYDPSRSPAANVPAESDEFIAAWRHMHDVFVREGATNVSWIWNPGADAGAVRRQHLMSFFPGTQYVDWIGGDVYDRKGAGFTPIVSDFYQMVQSAQPSMPIVLVETGEMTSSDQQPQYFSEIGSALPSQYPDIKALIYFDSRGPRANWALTPDGLAAFAKIAAMPYFGAMPR